MPRPHSRVVFTHTPDARSGPPVGPPDVPDVLCLSHLQWDFVFQRPQHLMTRCARDRRVFFIEEPRPAAEPRLDVRQDTSGVWIAVPGVPATWSSAESTAVVRDLVRELLDVMNSRAHVAWYLTPMALDIARDLAPVAIVFDCMDELSAFAHAPSGLLRAEEELFACADLVFTGGWSLYEAKRNRHPRVYPFPSSVDVPHFARARQPIAEPDDQRSIPCPRLGYFGVLDERLDLALLEGLADVRPSWHIVLIGPVAKIDRASLPRRPNIHLLGARPYALLPSYLAGWDVALLPFALNEATRFISPTKTPEYLAAGRAVVSTPVPDVVRPYGERGLVSIAKGLHAFVQAIDMALVESSSARIAAADAFLANQSWDDTWTRMRDLLDETVARREHTAPIRAAAGLSACPRERRSSSGHPAPVRATASKVAS
jgi:glycosyltransferase involved in cell wall biosynthesis